MIDQSLPNTVRHDAGAPPPEQPVELGAVVGDLGILRIAERFRAPAGLAAIRLPLGSRGSSGPGLLVILVDLGHGEDWRSVIVEPHAFEDGAVTLAFLPLHNRHGAEVGLIGIEPNGTGRDVLSPAQATLVAAALRGWG